MGANHPLRRQRSESLRDPGQGAARRRLSRDDRLRRRARARGAPPRPPGSRAARPDASEARRLRRARGAARACRLPPARCPVVLISGCSPTPEYRRRAEALRAAGLLRKPVSLETLLSVVARELGRPPQQSRGRAPRQARRGRRVGSLGLLRSAAVPGAAPPSARAARHRRAAPELRPQAQMAAAARRLSGRGALESRQRVPRQLPGARGADHGLGAGRVAPAHEGRKAPGRDAGRHGPALGGRGRDRAARPGGREAVRDLRLADGRVPLRGAAAISSGRTSSPSSAVRRT